MIATKRAVVGLRSVGEHDPSLVAMHMPMFRAMRQSQFRGDGQLKKSTIAMMDAAALTMGMMVQASAVMMVVWLLLFDSIVMHSGYWKRSLAVVTWTPACKLIQKIGKTFLAGLERKSFVPEAAFDFGVLTVIGTADARRDANRPFK